MSPTIAKAVQKELQKHREAEEEDRRLEARASELAYSGARQLEDEDLEHAGQLPASQSVTEFVVRRMTCLLYTSPSPRDS